MTRLVLGLMLCVLTASAALAKQGVVKTKNGQTYEGDVEEKNDFLTVTIKGIQTRVAQRDVASVTYPEDYDKQLADKRAKLDKTDVKGRIALARDAFNNKRYIVARDILEEALTIDPNNTEANELRDTTMAQIRLERAKQNPPATTEPRFSERANAATTASTGPAEAQDRRFLKPADINTIRQYELQDTETDVPIRFERDVKRRYATKLSNRPIEEFMSLTPMQQAMEILKNGPPEMRNDVKIMRDPQAMMIYRRTVQPYVLPNCATSQCHGGNNAGHLVLFSPADSDQATYTNFFILQAYTRKAGGGSGVFGKGELKLIDRTQPGKSLLLQYSIPQNLAEFDHPDVPGYKPALRGADDIKYRQMLSWIHDSLNPSLDQPNYGINFPVPGASMRPTSAPATQPATTTSTTTPTPAPRPVPRR